ncbi:UNVERIFIED_CONTAM: hypothetical protein RMT77_014784 [Armadillidium vulgare]
MNNEMNIKEEIEVKIEVLDAEYNSFQQDSQGFSDNEANFTVQENIKNEELGLKVSIKVLKELDMKFVFPEEEAIDDLIKSENPTVIGKDLSAQHSESKIRDLDQIEKCSEVKRNLKSRPQESLLIIDRNNCKSLRCKYCDLNFESNDELKSHLILHKKKFKCDHCNYETNLKSCLNSHLKVHSDVKVFKCSHCSYESKWKDCFRTHMLTHESTKLYKCSVCSYESNHKGCFKRHTLRHENVKLFKCSHCSYQSNRKDSLRTHMFIHGNVRLFKCSDCSYECNQKVSLRLHMLMHEDVKLFQCSECTYGCNYKARLKRHMRKHENALRKLNKNTYACS